MFKSSSATAPELTGTNGSIPSISSAKATVSGFTNNTWGYKPTKKSGSSWNNLAVQHGSTTYNSGYYLPGPTTTDDILDTTDVANTTANEYNLALATKLDLNTPSGSYGNTFTVTVVPNELPGILLTFDANGGNFSGQPTNVLTYSIPELAGDQFITKYTSSRTDPYDENSRKTSFTDNTPYGNYWGEGYYDDITIPGASALDVKIYYATDSETPDTVCLLNPNTEPDTYSECNYQDTISGSLAGYNNSGTTSADTKVYNGTISGDTARIYFYGGLMNFKHLYGYWAEITTGKTQNLLSGTYATPSRPGYVFYGWSTNPNAIRSDYDLNSLVSENTTIYAVWVPLLTDPTFKLNQTSIANITYMQEMNSTICSNMPQETQYQLKDSRDNKYYYVAKLKDGKCWMTQNLDLDLDNTEAFSSTNTNLANGTYWVPERSTIHTTNNTVSGWANGNNLPYSADRGDVYSASGSSSSLTSIDCTVTGNTNCHYHIGNHYNWSAAVASNNTSGLTADGTDASTSICPKGWRLPTSGSFGEYKALITTAYSIASSSAGETALRSSPLWFVRSGHVHSGLLDHVESNGLYWSSTVTNSNNAYLLSFAESFVSPAHNFDRYFGISVRCVAE